MMPILRPVIEVIGKESSAIATIGYDESTQTLCLQYKTKNGPGQAYGASPVTPQQYAELTTPGVSLGAAINALKSDPSVTFARIEDDAA